MNDKHKQLIKNYLDNLQTTVHIDGNFDIEVEEVALIELVEFILDNK